MTMVQHSARSVMCAATNSCGDRTHNTPNGCLRNVIGILLEA